MPTPPSTRATSPWRARADDAMAFGYLASKRAAEEVVMGSGLPWSILRATQFHDLTLKTVAALARMPVVAVAAGARFQPVEAREVAQRLVDLAPGPARGLVADVGGPAAYGMADLVRSYLAATGRRRLVVPVRFPGRAAAAVRSGVILAPEHAAGQRTWEDFLADHVRQANGCAERQEPALPQSGSTFDTTRTGGR